MVCIDYPYKYVRDRESVPNEVKTPVRTVEDRVILRGSLVRLFGGRGFLFGIFFMNLRMQRVQNS